MDLHNYGGGKMKKWICGLSIIGLLVSMASLSPLHAAGSCVLTDLETIRVDQFSGLQRKILTLTCTGDGSITAYNIVPDTVGVRGWYLYNVSTNPGSSSPTAAYDITCVVDGENVCGTSLSDRSATATETALIAPTTQGYHMIDQTMALTFANNSANPSTIVIRLRFTNN